MTPRELNREIKSLGFRFKAEFLDAGLTMSSPQKDWNTMDKNLKEMRKEFERLYQADRSFSIMNQTSILIMLRLNATLRVVPQHLFGAYINLSDILS